VPTTLFPIVKKSLIIIGSTTTLFFDLLTCKRNYSENILNTKNRLNCNKSLLQKVCIKNID